MMVRTSRWLAGIALASSAAVILSAGCARKQAETTTEQQTQVTQEPAVGAQHGGKEIVLDAGTRAELVVDDTGMTTVYLYDASGAPVDPAGKTVTVTFVTPDGQAKEVTLTAMGTGADAHFMNPVDEAVVSHIKEQGSYTAKVTANMDGQTKTGQTQVTGLSTGASGM
jgi:hypothetical protein